MRQEFIDRRKNFWRFAVDLQSQENKKNNPEKINKNQTIMKKYYQDEFEKKNPYNLLSYPKKTEYKVNIDKAQFKKKEQHIIHEQKDRLKKYQKEGFNKNQKKEERQIIKDYKFNGQLFPVSKQIPENDVWKLKKLCAGIFDNIQSVEILYAKTRPVLFFQHGPIQDRKIMHYREVIIGSKRKKSFIDPQLFFRTFQKLYPTVAEEFCLIARFGLIMAEEKKLNKFKTITNLAKDYDKVHFFYTKKAEDQISFILFTKDLYFVEFTSSFVAENKQKYLLEYNLYQKFKKEISSQLIKQEDIFGVNEANSDDEQEVEQKYEGVRMQINQIEILKLHIQQLCEKNLLSYQEEIQTKNDLFNQMNQNGNTDQRPEMQKLSDEIMELNFNIENYQETTALVLKKLRELKIKKSQNKGSYKMLYKQMILAEKQLDSKLPIIGKKRELFNLLDSGNLIILEGETGSGKSTQLPQILCQYYKIFERQNSLPVLITQPRKLATRSLAERVAGEMDEKVHDFVQYQASCNNRKLNINAKIIFKLDRLVLDELTVDPLLKKYCCLVIDEAHERTISIDVILGRIMNLLENRKDFKIIVTSASMDIELFKRYFKKYIGKNLKSIKVSGRMFDVQQIFTPFLRLKNITDKIERVITDQILLPDLSQIKDQYKGHILVFCTGIDEIMDLASKFQQKLSKTVFKILTLHGRMEPQEQKEVFKDTNKIKIIFSTRIAETSITINGIKVVIDPGYDREMIYDQATKISSMQMRLISESSAKQRAGRAGRTNKGFCFRLYSQKEKKDMKLNKTPQIQNMALDTLVLRLKALKIDNILNFPYVSPPSKQGLQISIKTMKLVGCLDENSNLTQIGRFLVKIPIQPFLSRAIVEGIFYQSVIFEKNLLKQLQFSNEQKQKLAKTDIVESIVRILAMTINSSNLYFIKQNQREDAERKKFQEFSQQTGDFSLFLQVYQKFLGLYLQREGQKLKYWANQNYLSLKTLHQTRQIHKQIINIIVNYDLKIQLFAKELKNTRQKLKKFKSTLDVIIASLASSFITNISLYSGHPQIGYTLMAQQLPIQLYGTTCLSLQGKMPKWILSYNLYTNNNGQTFCKVAQSIDLNFIKISVPEKILHAFKILQAENCNPFYMRITKQLPSIVFVQILNDYRKRFSHEQFHFLNKFTLIFQVQNNTIDIFYQKKHFQTKMGNKHLYQGPQQIINEYIYQIQRKFRQPFIHDYIGQIKIMISDGYEINKIDFQKSVYVFKILVKNEIAEQIKYSCSSFGNIEVCEDKLMLYVEGQYKRNALKSRIQLIRNIIEEDIKYYEEIVDRRHKIPKGKLILTYYAGESKNNKHIFINYKKYEDKSQQSQYVFTMMLCLEKFHRRLNTSKFQISKNESGINCYFLEETDEYQFINNLNKYKDQMGPIFQMPQSIIKFRQPELPQCAYTDKQWEEKIKQLLKPLGADNEKYTIRIWGTYKRTNKDEKIGQFEKSFRVNMHAEIETFNHFVLEKFIQKYQGKNVLGTEKLHAKFQFLQTAAVIRQQIYQALSEKYHFVKNRVLRQFPNVIIQESNPKRFRNVNKIFITIRGEKREDFFEPSRKINDIFRPKQKKIEPKYAYRFNRYSGNSIMDFIEYRYKFQVFLHYERKSSTLKTYCNDEDYDQICQNIDSCLKQIDLKNQNIPYRGRSLNSVEKIIRNIQKQIEINNKLQNNADDKKVCFYEVNYQRRWVSVTADIQTLQNIKNQVNKIDSIIASDCELCCGPYQQPYRLFNCSHTFCLLCLFKWIEESCYQNSQNLKCPGCQEKICIYDIQRMLSTEQFDKISDIQVSRYIEKNKKYHTCFSPGCQQIFLTEQSQAQNQFQCELCGKCYCFRCKASHKGFNCDKQMDIKILEKLGIKKCPKCQRGIQKDGGCNHMHCKSCNNHFCWVCLESFQTSDKCYDHLSIKRCGGGIFPNMIRE